MGRSIVEFVGRQIIENKLLAAMTDDEVVVILLTRTDINELINQLKQVEQRTRWRDDFITDLHKLREKAFN